MRKLLGLLGALGLVASSSSVVVSCGKSDDKAIDLSAVKLTTDKDTTGATLAKDADNDSNFTGSITADATKITLDFSGMTDNKDKNVTVDADKTIVHQSTASDTKVDASKLTANVASPVDTNKGPVITAEVSGIAEKNVVVIAFTVDGFKESTVTLTVAKAGTPSAKKDLSKVVATKALGEITEESATTLPSAEHLATALNEKNSGLGITKDDFDIATDPAQSTTTATITAKGNNFTGTVAVTYTVKAGSTPSAKKDLSKVVATKALGEITEESATTLPSAEHLATALNAKNSGLGITKDDFDIAKTPAQSATGATITAKGNNFTGTVAVTYTVKVG
ncbi:lipoprotein [Spiroplasma endosymbiont of Aspidapion aeneum]|uniref:lipoprotein n=1 Tax=Spiroplasma endosymbiont of Aspidapion aeneum TaxID=3066276 RepID=UPI00313B49B4